MGNITKWGHPGARGRHCVTRRPANHKTKRRSWSRIQCVSSDCEIVKRYSRARSEREREREALIGSFSRLFDDNRLYTCDRCTGVKCRDVKSVYETRIKKKRKSRWWPAGPLSRRSPSASCWAAAWRRGSPARRYPCGNFCRGMKKWVPKLESFFSSIILLIMRYQSWLA